MALLELESIVAGYVEGIDILNDLTMGVVRGSVTGVSNNRINPTDRRAVARMSVVVHPLRAARGLCGALGRPAMLQSPTELMRSEA